MARDPLHMQKRFGEGQGTAKGLLKTFEIGSVLKTSKKEDDIFFRF